MGPGEPELIHIRLPPNKYHRNSSQLGPIQSGLDSFSNEYRTSTGYDTYATPNLHMTQQRSDTGHGGGDTRGGQMGQDANQTRRNISIENRGPRYNLRLSHPPRSHPTYLPHPGPALTTNRAKPRIWRRGGQAGQEENRMVPSNLSSPGSTSRTEEPHSVTERGRRP